MAHHVHPFRRQLGRGEKRPRPKAVIRALLQYYAYYGNAFTVECPTGSGKQVNLYQVAEEIAHRLGSIFF
jgi:hypothetical protein